MICPKCRVEYRHGFKICSDCDVALVDASELAAGAGEGESAVALGDPAKDPFCSFWKGTDLRVCTEVCTVLDEAGIPHKTIRRQDHLFNLNNQSPYEVGVPASLYEKAEAAIQEAFGSDTEGGGGLLLTEKSSASFQELVDLPLEEKLKGRPEEEVPTFLEQLTWKDVRSDEAETAEERTPRESGEWFPEDATSRVWEGEPAEARDMIEMSLAENDIRTRWELQGAKAKLFVLPEDELRAKEIVREVVEGEPPPE